MADDEEVFSLLHKEAPSSAAWAEATGVTVVGVLFFRLGLYVKNHESLDSTEEYFYHSREIFELGPKPIQFTVFCT